MTMPRGVTEIDRLIEQGLTLYGEGDLDGALLLWERVLVIDPENPQANSYVEYVRLNYELLTTDGQTEDSGPFGIGDGEPEYQIEILPGEDVAPAAPAPLYMDARDEGWVIGDEGGNGAGRAPDELLFELEADEPPINDPTSFETDKTGENVSFDDNTREYPGGAGRPTSALLGHGTTPLASSDFEPSETPAFGSAQDFQTPQAFASQPTDVRRRELGFVQPTDAEHRLMAGPPELKIKLRTPVSQVIPIAKGTADVHRAPTANGDHDGADDAGEPDDLEATLGGNRETTLDLESSSPALPAAPAYESLDLDLSGPSDPQVTIDLVGRADTRPALGDAGNEAEDLIASLPTPRTPASPTKPLPGKTRAPATDVSHTAESAARASGVPTVPPATETGKAQTQEFPFTLQLDPLLAVHPDPHHPMAAGATRDFGEKPTSEHRRPVAPGGDPMISAPTRELGLRELGPQPAKRSELRATTDDETTSRVDVQQLRSARSTGKPEIHPGMDPIDARSAEILEDIDRATPGPLQPGSSGAFRAAIETREERTRRRITALLERATEWSRSSDLERAVTAVDLALSEDPNSALAQKLIHRNREVIMNAFQAFLGDLQRTPALARPLHELGSAPISPRAAFLLSRVDGTLSLDEILDVSGMPRLEAYRYLCQLFLRGILR